eukprot:CAMPEP_0184753518 /NCGR_PEP_ID=MMETSP0315-20130426/44144_1 /TAXON_ID=101924 /ORGANISM="Rhodosorus marinus, Strain UTEX LB 2760" /LENGTH=203 /DNA_ID=CAMNT_0027232899 /DNA_START=232 /DNA_END=843 /DNA_ORIENTATION=+
MRLLGRLTGCNGQGTVRGFSSLIEGGSSASSYTAKISQIIDSGQAKYFTVPEDWTVFQAVKQMVDHHCGSLIVKNGKTNSMVGIITERDYLTKIITRDRASKTTLVKEIMTKHIISVDASATVGESMKIMASHNIRHLPVLENNQLVGVVSMRELVKKVAEYHERHISYLMAQIQRMAIVVSTSPLENNPPKSGRSRQNSVRN